MKSRKIEIQSNVINGAKELFFLEGYGTITADRIAKKAGISKKTLYRYFISKREILEKVVENVIINLTYQLNDILLKENISYPEKLKETISAFSITLSLISNSFLADIQRNAPDVWKKIIEFKKDMAFNHFRKLLDEGLRQGQINPNINKDISILIMLSAVNNLFNPIFLNQLPENIIKKIPESTNDIYNQVIKVIYEGILSDTAKKHYSIK
jgi:AcrR family transcriptional regulator